jgi:hypothetical protein
MKKELSSAFGSSAPKVIMPKRVGMALEHAFGRPTTQPLLQEPGETLRWSEMVEFADVVGEYLYSTANDIASATRAIDALGGPSRVTEYNRLIKTITMDLERFSDEVLALKTSASSQGDFVLTPDSNVLYLQIYEKLNTAQTYYHGVIHHAMIAITEFSLEANDKAKAKAALSVGVLTATQPDQQPIAGETQAVQEGEPS